MTTLDERLPPAVLDALKRNQPIEAIKLLRGATGLGLKEAKDRIDAHGTGVVAGRFTPAQGDALPADVESALRRGNTIEAIRLLRGHTGLGLKEAKDTVAAAAGKLKIARDGYSPGEVRESRYSTWLIAVAIVTAAVAYCFLYASG